jgi:hypothetical protein
MKKQQKQKAAVQQPSPLIERLKEKPPKVKIHPNTRGSYVPVEEIEAMLDEDFGVDNWEFTIVSAHRSFDKLDVIVALSVTFPKDDPTHLTGYGSVTRYGSATIVTRKASNADGLTNLEDMDLPRAVSDAKKNAAKSLGNRYGRLLNKEEAPLKKKVEPKTRQQIKSDKAVGEVSKLLDKVRNGRKPRVKQITPNETPVLTQVGEVNHEVTLSTSNVDFDKDDFVLFPDDLDKIQPKQKD